MKNENPFQKNQEVTLTVDGITGEGQGVGRIGGGRVERGVFGADMKVRLLNDGPFTVILDSEDLK